MSVTLRPYAIDIETAAIEDLRRRLAQTRWPEPETVTDWSQGIPLAYVQELCRYWATDYDWRRAEAALNAYPQFITELDGLDIHFLHVRSNEAQARPLLLTHGWPGSVVEFLGAIPALTDPVRHGGRPENAFHLVVPSLPGYGFSGKPTATGWGAERTADAWSTLMARLGYAPYLAQGGDWGAMVTTAIGARDPEHCGGIHVNMPVAGPGKTRPEDMTEREKSAVAGWKFYQDWDSGYSKQQSTRPQTVGYGLVDSPAGQCAWIVEKFYQWMDCQGHPENVVTRDQLLDNVSIYWFTASAASSARFYWESFGRAPAATVQVPTGCSIFPKEIFRPSRRWAEHRYRNIVYWNELERGGHFAAFEQPALFVEELRRCFAEIS